MKTLTSDQIQILSKYEHQFQTAVYSKYLRAMPQSFYSEFVKICGEVGVRVNMNCSSCMFDAVSTIGKAYYAHQQNNQTNRETSAPDSSEQVSNTEQVSNDQVKQPEQPKPKKAPDVSRKPSKTSKPKSNISNNKTNKKA